MHQWSHPAYMLQGTRGVAQWSSPVTNLVDGMDRAKQGRAAEGLDDLCQVLTLATYLDGGSDALPCKQQDCAMLHTASTVQARPTRSSTAGAGALQTVYLVEGLNRLAGGSRSAGKSRKAINCSLRARCVIQLYAVTVNPACTVSMIHEQRTGSYADGLQGR